MKEEREHRVQLGILPKSVGRIHSAALSKRDARFLNLSGGGAYVLTDDLLIFGSRMLKLIVAFWGKAAIRTKA
ncbi:MAG: hypothetical protein U0Y68_23335 [Blastocatellia bacterium]